MRYNPRDMGYNPRAKNIVESKKVRRMITSEIGKIDNAMYEMEEIFNDGQLMDKLNRSDEKIISNEIEDLKSRVSDLYY